MRLHTNKIDATHLHEATLNLPGVSVQWTMHGSRSHARAFEVSLTGNGQTGGQWGNTDQKSATWDEWGTFLAALYEIDPDALWGTAKNPVYRDAADFHFQTCDRFSEPGEGLPADTHKRHNWHADYPNTPLGEWACTKCSATRQSHY